MWHWCESLLWAKQNCSLDTNFAVPIFNVIVHDFMTMSHTTAPTHSQTNAMMINMVFVEQRGQIFFWVFWSLWAKVLLNLVHTYFRKALCSKRTSLKRAFFPWQNNQNTHRWNIPQSISHSHGHFVAKSLHWKKNLTISIIIIYGRIDTVANKWCEPNFIYARDIYHKNIFRVL